MRRRLWLLLVTCWLLPAPGHAAERIVYTRPDGGVSVVNPAPACLAELARPLGTPSGPSQCPALGLAGAEALEWIRQQVVPPEATNVRIVDSASLPPRQETDSQGDSRVVRNAWRDQGGQIVVDRQVLGPHWSALLPRLRAVLPEADRGRLADWLNAVEEAVRTRDAPRIRGLLTSLQQDAARRPPAGVMATVEQTFRVKGFTP